MSPTGRSTGRPTVASRAGGVLLLAVVLTACGDVGNGDGTRPSVSPTRTPTAEVPSSTEPTGEPTSAPPSESATEPTSAPTSAEPPTELPSPTRTPTRTPDRTERPDEPETPPTPETSQPPPTAPETAQEEAPETEPPAPGTTTGSPEAQEPESAPAEEADPAEEQGVPAWVWWLAAALVLGGLVAIPLVVRSRRRNAWDRDLAAEEAEVAWLARELLPELRRAASREEVAGGWAVSQARVSAAEDRLTVLESSAPDEPRRTRARVVRDASRTARAQLQQLLGPGSNDTWALDLDSVIIDLEAALRPAPVSGPT